VAAVQWQQWQAGRQPVKIAKGDGDTLRLGKEAQRIPVMVQEEEKRKDYGKK